MPVRSAAAGDGTAAAARVGAYLAFIFFMLFAISLAVVVIDDFGPADRVRQRYHPVHRGADEYRALAGAIR